MYKRATKQETELRVAHAAELVAEGQAYSSITSLGKGEVSGSSPDEGMNRKDCHN